MRFCQIESNFSIKPRGEFFNEDQASLLLPSARSGGFGSCVTDPPDREMCFRYFEMKEEVAHGSLLANWQSVVLKNKGE